MYKLYVKYLLMFPHEQIIHTTRIILIKYIYQFLTALHNRTIRHLFEKPTLFILSYTVKEIVAL